METSSTAKRKRRGQKRTAMQNLVEDSRSRAFLARSSTNARYETSSPAKRKHRGQKRHGGVLKKR